MKGDFCEMDIDGLKFGIYYGTSSHLTEAAILSWKYDVFVCGHTHIELGETKGNTIVLNPGTAHRNFPNLNGQMEYVPSIIIFDTQLSYKFVSIF